METAIVRPRVYNGAMLTLIPHERMLLLSNGLAALLPRAGRAQGGAP
jgi:hypothetical protein